MSMILWYDSLCMLQFSTAVRIPMMNDQSDVDTPDNTCFIIVLHFWALLVNFFLFFFLNEKRLIAKVYE